MLKGNNYNAKKENTMRKCLKSFQYIFMICFILAGGCTIVESKLEQPSTPGYTHCCNCCLCDTSGAPPEEIPSVVESNTNKHAVLISAGIAQGDDVGGNSEFWYDLVLQYKMLRENGFEDENIYVLYGKGADFISQHYPEYNSIAQFGHLITKASVTKENIKTAFDRINASDTEKDHLYVWWMGHGACRPGTCNLSLFIGYTDENVDSITDEELSRYINSVSNCKNRTLALMTCHSGGIIDNVNAPGSRMITLTSSKCEQNSYSYDNQSPCDRFFHAEFNSSITNALRQKDLCDVIISPKTDINSDGHVSLWEASQYNESTMQHSTPQMGDPDGISSSTHL